VIERDGGCERGAGDRVRRRRTRAGVGGGGGDERGPVIELGTVIERRGGDGRGR
jgi:hypothetical protein